LTDEAGEQFEVPEDFEPFCKIELQVKFEGRAEEAAAPAAAAAVGYGSADCAARGEEEEVDVRVYLADCVVEWLVSTLIGS